MTAPFRKTSRSSLLCCLIATLIVFTLASSVAAFAAVNGAIYTTNITGTKVNGNLYGLKTDVYLNGGPQNTSDPGLTPGNGSTPANYYFQVTDPSGATLLSADDISCRQVVVQNGRIIGVPSDYENPYATAASGTLSGCDHPLGTFNASNNEEPVQLCPAATRSSDNLSAGQFYDPNNWCDTTPNPGGEYKAWLTPVADYVGIGVACASGHGNNVWGFCDQDSKTDNFKVQPPPPPPCTPETCPTPPPPSASLVACKYWDKDDDGFNEHSDVLLSGWTITASTTDPTLAINGGTPGASASGVTDSTGCTTFSLTAFPDATTVETVTLTETQQTNWNQVAPLSGATGSLTYTGGTGGSITVTGNCVADSVTGLVAPCTSTSSVPLIGDGSTTAAPDFGNTGLDLTVTKSANPAFLRTYAWNITKSVNPTEVDQSSLTPSATFNYTVHAYETGFTDSGWQVTGSITVTNPNSFDVGGVTVTEVGDAVGTCTLDTYGSASVTSVTVPAGKSVSYSYTCTYGSNPTSGTNTATAGWTAVTYNTPDASATGTAGYTFAGPTNTKYQTVTVTDCFNGTLSVSGTCSGTSTQLGTLTATDATPFATATYLYSHVEPIPSNGCVTYPNTARIVETNQTASASAKVCRVAEKTGALTMGFWQNKNGQAIITNYCGGTSGTSLHAFLTFYHPFSDETSTTCSGEATYVYNVIKVATCTSTSKTCNSMLKAQMLATALDVYFSASSLGGNRIGAPSAIGADLIDLTQICRMIDGTGGTATCSGTYENVSSAFGGATSLSVSAMLLYQNTADPTADAGANWYRQVKATQVLAKDAFDAINNGVAFAP